MTRCPRSLSHYADLVLSRAVTVAAALALAVLGAVAGILGAFQSPHPWIAVPVGIGTGLVLGFGGAWGLRSGWGAGAPAVGWIVVVFVLGSRRPEGDLIVTSSGGGLGYLFGGLAAFGAALGAGRLRLRRRAAPVVASPEDESSR